MLKLDVVEKVVMRATAVSAVWRWRPHGCNSRGTRCNSRGARAGSGFVVLGLLLLPWACMGEHWPRFRGPEGNAVADFGRLPLLWSADRNIRWKTAISGEGSSSPIVWGDAVFLTSAREKGGLRLVHRLERDTGRLVWSRTWRDPAPERSSALTGHAAATPASDGKHVVAFFGNAGLVCHDFDGNELWRKQLGGADGFDTELGLAASPIIHDGKVIQVCDHDGEPPRSFHSFLVALDARTGKELWKTQRKGMHRSWSTPIVIPSPDGGQALIVNSPERLCAYDLDSGKLRWEVPGMTEWVAPSPVFGRHVAHGLLFAASGKNGPLFAVQADGKVVWQDRTGGPYVCSPVLLGDHLYVHNEQGILTCYRAATGEVLYRERLPGKFTASPVVGDGKVFATNEDGVTLVLKTGSKFELLARNNLKEFCLASPALSAGEILLRTERHLFCIARGND